ncbi:hypothetical protein CF54_19260 [Streptomyces sp. Tu 6176]|uniref:hypothetical protein n=1 Tax=Streptomyces sp. Tu 6176 TaxID=1470557 RepID=UPI000447F476|nr:hypothetical protein [Streptomyces sp. Tu 6176]EYT81493.1 hypothetical protein CF54_19260 [Streptomyces sp. Tu 6176]
MSSPPSCSYQSHWAYEAKHSARQPSRQSSNDTLSPNHWWASSCAIATSNRPTSYVGRLCVSSSGALAARCEVTMAPAEENGYGPNRAQKRSRIFFWSASDSASTIVPGPIALITGVPSASWSVCTVNRSTARVLA